jgi:starvation-inducible DNA-binding protein
MYKESEYELSKEGLAKLLACILADNVTIHYLAHGYHWNVKGPEFIQFHDFFEELYEDAAEAEDPIAENIRKLGFDAPHFLLELAALSCIEVRPASGDPMEMSANLYMAYVAHCAKLNDAFAVANAISAQGIADFLASRIDIVDKWIWQIGTTIGADSMSVSAPLGKSEAEVPVNATHEGMHPVVVELQPTVFTSRNALVAAGRLVPEEKDLARALVEIADKYGKFDEDQTGIWADYHEPEDNPYAEMGVKCGNCVLYQGGDKCAVVAFSVHPEGYCRFAVLPDGAVDPSKAPAGKTKGNHEYRPGEFSGGAGAPAEMLDMNDVTKRPKHRKPLLADADYGDACPPATQDIALNIENRQKAIDNVGYGPLNPAEPNDEFWQDKGDRWNIDPMEAKKSICGNCVFFDRRPKTLDCIETGIAEGGSGEASAWDAIDQAELGYCTALDFKCAASRTCNAWAAGGPITEDVQKETSSIESTGFDPILIDPEDIELASDGPCWDGYKQVGMKEKNGKMVPNCVPDNEASVTATAGSKPAPKKDQIKGSDKNKKGSASSGRKVTFSKKVEDSLKEKVETHNKSVTADSKKVTLSMLKAVYRRGAGAFSTSHRPDQNRNSWAHARVNAFLKLVKSGSPSNSKYTQDNDLLPSGHPKSSRTASAMTATGYAERELYIQIEDESTYQSPEDALYALAEYSGLGYESIPIFRAAWRRGVANNESPFDRAAELAINLYDSKDADLLPKQQTESEPE